MIKRLRESQVLENIAFFFPVQLLLVHLKKNVVLLLYWLLLFGFITQNFADKYGIPQLFLFPEYMGETGFWSYFILGFSCGGFIMAFNISSYIMNGFRFPFLATISHPFTKYCLNNSLLPLAFVVTYIFSIISFQYTKEYQNVFEIILYVSAFIIGNLIFIFLALTYFIRTNKDLFKIFGVKVDEDEPLQERKKVRIKPVKDILHKNVRWNRRNLESKDWPVRTYLANPFKVRVARDCSHYDKRMLGEVFYQNHINAAYFEILTIVSLLLLGLFREYAYFMIPAGATIILLFTMFMMLSSAIYSWFRGWSTAVFLGVFLLVNFLSKFQIFNYQENVYGLNYKVRKASFDYHNLKKHANDSVAEQVDFENTIRILENWKRKASEGKPAGHKPKMVIVCTSGGGLRAAGWSFHALQYSDSVTGGQLLRNTHLMTGSSGGLIGISYLRELYLRQQTQGLDLYKPEYKYRICNDLLNPIAFSVATNDLFIRLQKFNYGGHAYVKDRAYIFEKTLIENTGKVLDKRLLDYTKPEYDATIPLLIFAPTIINDGRRLLVSSQGVSYLVGNNPLDSLHNVPLPENIEFLKFFKDQGAANTRFTSTLRMNATFPYILPVASLPSQPVIEVMDGGIRDNYGIKTAIKYLFVFRDWISQNTSGVIIIQTRDKHKEFELVEGEGGEERTILQNFTSPLGSFYVNFDKIQNFNHDELLQYASLWFKGRLDVVDFELMNEQDKKISMSWHLTTKEKIQVLHSIDLPENQRSVQRIKELLQE